MTTILGLLFSWLHITVRDFLSDAHFCHLVSARNAIFYTAHARRAGHKTRCRRKILHLKRRVYGANYMIEERDGDYKKQKAEASLVLESLPLVTFSIQP